MSEASAQKNRRAGLRLALALIALVGASYHLGMLFYLGLVIAAAIAAYHYHLIRQRDRLRCFAAFRHNNWLGAAVFIGIVLG